MKSARFLTHPAVVTLALMIGLVPRAATASGSLVVGEVDNEGDGLGFTFTSTCPAGTNYQPQFIRALRGSWLDIPDATVTEVAGKPGTFRVSAPKFGGGEGFFRVIAAGTAPTAPIAPTLNAPAAPAEDQLLLLWNERPTGAPSVQGKLYGFAAASPDGQIPASFQPLPRAEFGGELGLGASAAQDVVAVDFSGDGIPDPVFCWARGDGKLQLVLPPVAGDGSPWNAAIVHVVPGPVVFTSGTDPPAIIRLVAAQLDHDLFPEVGLAYTTSDAHIHLVTIDFNGTPSSPPTFGVPDETTLLPSGGTLGRSARFDLAAGDFDGDTGGLDELALVCARPVTIPNGVANWQLYVRFFRATPAAVTPVSALTPEATAIFTKAGTATVWLNRVAAEAADFDGDAADELAVGFTTSDTTPQGRWYLQMLATNAGLSTVQLDTSGQSSHHQSNGDVGHPLTLTAVQIDQDPAMELIYAGRQVDFFEIGAGLKPTSAGVGTVPVERDSQGRRHLVLTDLEPPATPGAPDWPEVVSVREFLLQSDDPTQAILEVTAHRIVSTIPGLYSLQEIARTRDEAKTANNLNRTVALVTASFAPLDLKLGIPRRSTRIVSHRPTVVVNAPPVHFDVLQGVLFDVCRMFPISDCGIDPDSGELVCPFIARFTRTAAASVSVETRWKRSWDVSVDAGGGFGIPLTPAQVKAEVRSRFGEDFDTYAADDESTVVEVQVDAIDDDRIYATTLSYDIWEYPVVLNGSQVVGHIVLVVPSVTQQNWFASKSVIAQSYRPFHEVGNLLSYRQVPEPYPGFELVRPIVSDTFTVAATGGSSVWRLTKSIGSTTTQSKTFNFSLGTSASFDIPLPFIPNVEVSGDYSSSLLNSNTTTLADTNGLACTFGILDGNLAGATYSITPFLYWDRTGALVLDYAVNLPLGTPSLPSFWRQNYSLKPDPTFILPWRNDPEKGVAVVGDQRRLTRDICCLPIEPRPGQAVTIQGRISNFSLLAVGTPVTARFHLGDPALGGPQIHQTTIPAGLGSQAKHLIEFPYTVPDTTSAATIAIYCVLDPANTIDEIHEDNNIGWAEIFLRNTP